MKVNVYLALLHILDSMIKYIVFSIIKQRKTMYLPFVFIKQYFILPVCWMSNLMAKKAYWLLKLFPGEIVQELLIHVERLL